MTARRTRWIVLIVLGLGLAAGLGWLFAPRPVPVDIAEAMRAPIAETLSDQGAVRVRESYVIATPVSGRLQRIALKVGDAVGAGQEIARVLPAAPEPLDPRAEAQAQAAIAAAAAVLQAAAAEEARLAAEATLADQELSRVSILTERGVATRQSLDAATASANASRAAAAAASAQVQARRAELDRARAALTSPEAGGGGVVIVRAPSAGYVTRVLQESARSVATGTPLVEVGDVRQMEAAIEFLSQDAVRIRPGMAAEIYDWGGAGVLPARVRRVEPQAFTKISALGVEEQRVLVLLEPDGPAPATLGPGYRVWGRVILRREPAALTVPVGALVRDGGGWATYRILDGRARLTKVEIRAITDRAAEVTSGLPEGQAVVVFPSDRVADGVRVRAR